MIRPSARGEYELTDTVGVLVRAGASVEAVGYEGRRWNVNEPADVERAVELLEE
jgi:glucose-1-phosphate thymidylyltransferase